MKLFVGDVELELGDAAIEALQQDAMRELLAGIAVITERSQGIVEGTPPPDDRFELERLADGLIQAQRGVDALWELAPETADGPAHADDEES